MWTSRTAVQTAWLDGAAACWRTLVPVAQSPSPGNTARTGERSAAIAHGSWPATKRARPGEQRAVERRAERRELLHLQRVGWPQAQNAMRVDGIKKVVHCRLLRRTYALGLCTTRSTSSRSLSRQLRAGSACQSTTAPRCVCVATWVRRCTVSSGAKTTLKALSQSSSSAVAGGLVSRNSCAGSETGSPHWHAGVGWSRENASAESPAGVSYLEMGWRKTRRGVGTHPAVSVPHCW